jgi:hypothetical protein
MPKVIYHLFNDEVKNRQKMQDKISSAAAELAAREKIEDIAIGSIVKKAEVSERSFYKCFQSTESVYQDAAKKLTEQIFSGVKDTIQPDPDIAILVATKTRLGIQLLVASPTLAKLALKIRWPVGDTELLILQDIKKDVEEGIKQGRFADIPSSIGINLIFSTLKSAIQEMLSEQCPTDYENQAIYQMLLGLGVDTTSALEISKIPMSELPPLPNKGVVRKFLNLITSDKPH